MNRLAMRKVILFLLLCVFEVQAQTLTQGKSASQNGVTSTAIAYNSNISSGGSLLVGGCDFGVASNNLTSATDSLSQTWSPVTAVVANGAGPINGRMYFFPNSAAGANTVTFNFTSSCNPHCWIAEFAGVATVSPLDATGTNTGNGSATVSTSGATTQANEVVVASLGDGSCTTPTVGAGYTIIAGTGCVIGEYKTVTSTGTQTATAGNLAQYAASIGTFKAPAAAGGAGAKKKKIIFY